MEAFLAATLLVANAESRDKRQLMATIGSHAFVAWVGTLAVGWD